MSQPGEHPQQPQHPENPYGEQPTAPYGQAPAGSQPDDGSYGGGSSGGSYGGGSYGGPYGGGSSGGAYGGGPTGGGPTAGVPDRKGVIGALFDLSFSTFVTPMIIRVVYIIGLVLIGLATLFFALSGFFGDNPLLGIFTLILAPVVGLLYLCLFRMLCEFYIAITRMSEDINRRLPQA